MIYVAHRINTVAQLRQVPYECGVEVDLRDHGDELILQHDPFIGGEKFQDYLKYYNHALLILNIKSERVEFRVLELLQKYGIKNYFFLDSSFPMIYQLISEEEKNIAVRFSEFEPIEGILAMKDKVGWVWVDCFTKLSIDQVMYQRLKDAGFKLCLVSPELQGRQEDIPQYKSYLSEQDIVFDAICTKLYNVDQWC